MMEKSDSTKEIFGALAKAHIEIEKADKDKENPHFRSKYADLGNVVDAIKPALGKNGLSFTQICHEAENAAKVETIIMHQSGEWLSCGCISVPVSKNDAQGFGSALTYARRYSLSAAFGVAPEDDDGNAASKAAPAARQAPAKGQSSTELSADQQKYFPRVKAALDTLYGDDVAKKKAKIKELTTFTGKDDKVVEGVEDYRKLTGKRLEILCHLLEKLVPEKDELPSICFECLKNPCTCKGE